jgi:hypothetical protein
MNINSIIEKNSNTIRLNYAYLLHNYLLQAYPEQAEHVRNLKNRIEDVMGSSSPAIITFVQNENIAKMQKIMLDYLPNDTAAGPSSPRVATAPEDDESMTEDGSIETTVGINIQSEDALTSEDAVNSIVTLLADLLAKNSLQTLTLHALQAFKDRIGDTVDLHSDDFIQELEFDQIDCDLDNRVRRFVELYNIFGTARCVVTNVEYFANRIRNDAQLLNTLPKTVRTAVDTIVDLVDKKLAYTKTLTIDSAEFSSVNDDTVRSLLNKYAAHTPISFTSRVAADMSTDEDDIAAAQMTQSLRRKPRKRSALPPAAAVVQSKRQHIEAFGETQQPTTVASNESNIAFINNVKQLHADQYVIPKLVRYLVNVIPTDVSASLLTCPTNGLGNNIIGTSNNSKMVGTIAKMNIAVVSENVYFYKLLEPLAFYAGTQEAASKMLWFITRCGNYFINNARNFAQLRQSLQSFTDDPDRVGVFMIRYNFLWFYRQFVNEILSSPTTAYQSQKILNYLYVFSTVVQKEYNKIGLRFNERHVYAGPVDNVVKLMVASLSDILI